MNYFSKKDIILAKSNRVMATNREMNGEKSFMQPQSFRGKKKASSSLQWAFFRRRYQICAQIWPSAQYCASTMKASSVISYPYLVSPTSKSRMLFGDSRIDSLSLTNMKYNIDTTNQTSMVYAKVFYYPLLPPMNLAPKSKVIRLAYKVIGSRERSEEVKHLPNPLPHVDHRKPHFEHYPQIPSKSKKQIPLSPTSRVILYLASFDPHHLCTGCVLSNSQVHHE